MRAARAWAQLLQNPAGASAPLPNFLPVAFWGAGENGQTAPDCTITKDCRAKAGGKNNMARRSSGRNLEYNTAGHLSACVSSALAGRAIEVTGGVTGQS